jgi:RimJ/RimL family protein N-acetyltransferase
LTDRTYPKTIDCGGTAVELRLMTAADEAAALAFGQSLPEHDLLFLSRDIAHPKVVAAWIAEIEAGSITTLLAWEGGSVVGCAAVVRDALSWSRHVGEIRVLVAPGYRGKGLGRGLAQEAMLAALDLGLKKLMVRMTIDQTAAIEVFETLGFTGEALLKDHVMDRSGRTHDLAVLSHDVDRVGRQMAAYGLEEAL